MLADEKPLYAMQVKRSAFEGCPPPLFDEPSGQRIHDLALWVARDELTVIELRAEDQQAREGPVLPEGRHPVGGVVSGAGANAGAGRQSAQVLRSPLLQDPDARRRVVTAILTALNGYATEALAEVGGTARAGGLRSCAALVTELHEALEESEMRRDLAEGSGAETISQMLLTLETALAGADWYYERSDDRRAFRAGQRRMEAITQLVRALESRGAGRAAAVLWRDYAPEGTHAPLAHSRPFTATTPHPATGRT